MTTTDHAPDAPAAEAALAEAVRLADGFIAGTNELDAARRAELIADVWTSTGHFIDPQFEATGHDELDALLAGVHATLPGVVFHRTSEVERLARWFRFRWELRAEDGTVVVAGSDTGEIDGSKLARIVSFYDQAVSA
jgi:hypothetical protein